MRMRFAVPLFVWPPDNLMTARRLALNVLIIFARNIKQLGMILMEEYYNIDIRSVGNTSALQSFYC